MRNFSHIFKMDFINNLKNPVLVISNSVFPALMILILGYLCSGSYANISDSYNYYALTMLIFCMLNGAMTTTNCFMERDIKKPNLRIIYSPVSNFYIYFSKITSSSLMNFVLHLITFTVLTPILHLNIGGRNIGYIILLMVPVEFAASALGALFCCIFTSEEASSTILSTVVSVFSFLGGTFFSFDGLGPALATISRISPVKWLNDAFFSIIFDGNLTPVLPVFVGSVIVCVLLTLGCTKTFKTEDYLC